MYMYVHKYISEIAKTDSHYFTEMYTGGPRNSQTFYLQIRLFTLGKVVPNNTFLVKNGLFIRKFSIRGPKWRNVSTENFEGNLYILCIFLDNQILIIDKVQNHWSLHILLKIKIENCNVFNRKNSVELLFIQGRKDMTEIWSS